MQRGLHGLRRDRIHPTDERLQQDTQHQRDDDKYGRLTQPGRGFASLTVECFRHPGSLKPSVAYRTEHAVCRSSGRCARCGDDDGRDQATGARERRPLLAGDHRQIRGCISCERHSSSGASASRRRSRYVDSPRNDVGLHCAMAVDHGHLCDHRCASCSSSHRHHLRTQQSSTEFASPHLVSTSVAPKGEQPR